jgi:Na+/proline symporter
MSPIDWIIVAAFVLGFALLAFYLKRYTRSVADFLAANRCAGRYLLTVAEGTAGIGAITIIAQFEQYYHAGFVPAYWMLMLLPISLVISLSGWVIYRYRQTRAMTLAQFFEMRYNRKFRVFAGILGFLSGVLNYGIFPSVTARFFIHFLQWPDTFPLLGLEIPTYAATMFVLLATALYLTLNGGQVVILVTDFLQGQMLNVALLAILVFVVIKLNWTHLAETMLDAPVGQSKINPFQSGKVSDFNMWYYLIALFGAFYGTMSWQGSQGVNASAKSPHEARMSKILSQWRASVTMMIPLLLPALALVIMNHAGYESIAGPVTAQLDTLEGATRSQLTTPLVLRAILPVGLLGLFVVVMLSAAVSTDNSYLHSWGSIFIQDVILPLRGDKPLDPKQHIRLLRLSIFGVAIFAFFFSLFFRQTQYILLFFAITGSIFTAGAGAAIIGGLYWKRGTTGGAWSAMIVGSILSVSGIIIKQVNPGFFLNGQQMWFIAMVSSATVYIVVSLLQNRVFNLDKLLRRGAYAEEGAPVPPRGLAALKPGKDFTARDRLLYFLTIGWSLTFFGGFVVITLWHNFVGPLDNDWWLGFWKVYIGIGLAKGIAVTIWFTLGGSRDLRDLLRSLRAARADASDNGTVAHPPAA